MSTVSFTLSNYKPSVYIIWLVVYELHDTGGQNPRKLKKFDCSAKCINLPKMVCCSPSFWPALEFFCCCFLAGLLQRPAKPFEYKPRLHDSNSCQHLKNVKTFEEITAIHLKKTLALCSTVRTSAERSYLYCVCRFPVWRAACRRSGDSLGKAGEV